MDSFFANASFLAAFGQGSTWVDQKELLTAQTHSGTSQGEDYSQGHGHRRAHLPSLKPNWHHSWVLGQGGMKEYQNV